MPQIRLPPTRLPALCLLLAVVAGCGGEDDGTPATIPDAIATPAQVRAHLQFVMSRAPVPRADHTMVPAPFTCTSGGSREVTAGSVESPYVQEPVTTERVTYRDCLRYTGPASDPDSSFMRIDGVEEAGQLQLPNGTLASYRGAGAAQASPLERQLRSTAPGGVYQEDHYLFSRAHGSERNSFFGLFRRVARFEGSFRFGTEAAPFRTTRRNQAMQLDGEYQIGTQRCPTGTMKVETIRELAYDDASSEFVAGLLRFTTDGGTAEAQFNADGSVQITGGDGTQVTEPWSQSVAPWDSDCFAAEEP
jgi:hypothetical protein